MDWKSILSQTSEHLDDGSKDELLQKIAWHDFDEEKIDVRMYSALVKLCQTLMKYKSEQVDVLLDELDELAKKQGESQARMQESDERSSKSKKSLDSDEQDSKYRELKFKYRKLQKLFEGSKNESGKLKESIKQLEQERAFLQAEIRDAHIDDTASDLSEIVKDQQQSLVDSVQHKNTQISQLLTDIENVESENSQMRSHLSSLRDEFADAIAKLEALISENKLLKVASDETNECSAKMRLETASLKSQIEDLLEDKAAREVEFDAFAKEIDVRIEDWRVILETKNTEIEQLKSRTVHIPDARPPSSSSSSLIRHSVDPQLGVLQQMLNARDADIVRLQKQLETATKEMTTTTIVLKQVTSERDTWTSKCDKLSDSLRSTKKQLQSSHARCQDLISDVQYHEALIQTKDQDIGKIIDKISDKNTKKLVKECEHLKTEKRAAERKVAELVKSCNKLRTIAERAEKENVSLRNRLGLSEDDFVGTKFTTAQSKLQKKQVESLRVKLETSEEEKLQYRLELQKLSTIISQLSQQLLELGESPRIDVVDETQSSVHNHIKEELLEMQTTVEAKALLSENDALRKGLHEILASVQLEQESSVREIRSETLESLLRALDAKHVSGWYHPAMRLQAEVHTLQGSNATLRGQLRTTREELEVYKEKGNNAAFIDCTLDSSNATLLANLNNHLLNVLKDYKVDDETNAKLVEKLESNKKEFLVIQERVGALFNQYTDEKTKWETDVEMREAQIKEMDGEKRCLEEQLRTIQLISDAQTDEEVRIKAATEAITKLAIMNRKIVYMENVDQKYRNEIVGLKEQLLHEGQETSARMHALKTENLTLKARLEQVDFAAYKLIQSDDLIKLQQDYDSLLMKHSETQRLVEDMSSVSLFDLQVNLLEQENIQSLYEERYKEMEKNNSVVVEKNMTLQESVKVLEDKLVHYVDLDVYKEVERDRNRLAGECQKLMVDMSRLQDELNVLRKEATTRSLWSNLDQYELHSLRHLVVDLQATGDDKAVIARLSSDVVAARLSEAEIRKKLDEIVAELATCKADNASQILKSTDLTRSWQLTFEAMRQRNSHLESVIKQQRIHYLGCIPNISRQKLIMRMRDIAGEKKRTQEMLIKTEELEHESQLIRETLETKTEILNELNQLISNGSEQAKVLEKWFLDKTNVQLQELRCRRQAEFKEAQLKYALTRQQQQDDEIAQLEMELLQSLCLKESNNSIDDGTQTIEIVDKLEQGVNACVEQAIVATQTSEVPKMQEASLLRQQLADKQSQIHFYEKHIVEMQQKKEAQQNNDALLLAIADKEKTVFELQSLLKKDRDEHSLAAARFHDELKELQARLASQQEQQQQMLQIDTPQIAKRTSIDCREPPENVGRTVVEVYIQQVHALEKHTMELQTSAKTLSSQLQASREECVRWSCLANDRLQSVDDLRLCLEEQHKVELDAYKGECEKWRNEVNNLQMYINEYKKDIAELRPNIEKELKEKDNKIHELLIAVRQCKTELRRKASNTQVRNDESLEEVKESLIKEQDVLRRRCEQLLNRERNAREEIRSLKGQLMKRPILSARSDSGSSKETQQHKRIAALEKEVEELKEKLERETALNDVHRTKVNADFDKWSKQKYWQQQTERTKTKLNDKTNECEKLQQTCTSYRMLIERMEREKHNLEVRVKSLKSATLPTAAVDANEPENAKLRAEIHALRAKLEQQVHHSGALSAAVLQDKLEAQERKIAVLELSAKGGGELRAELERVKSTNAALQKTNLRLETANVQLQVDVDKSTSELALLREQFAHLETYVAVLKDGHTEEPRELSSDAEFPKEERRTSELERTVIVLKRIVEKLQAENKRLEGGGGKVCSPNRSTQLPLKEHNEQKITALQEEAVKAKVEHDETNKVVATLRMELKQKTELLEKIKVLLQRAAGKEKALLEEVNSLKAIMGSR